MNTSFVVILWLWSNKPEHLPNLLDYLPAQTPLGLYNRGPNWLYAAVAVHTYSAPIYQFDVRLGWIEVPTVNLVDSSASSSSLASIHQGQAYQRPEIKVPNSYLDYDEAELLTLPLLSADRGIVLSGSYPSGFGWRPPAPIIVRHGLPFFNLS